MEGETPLKDSVVDSDTWGRSGRFPQLFFTGAIVQRIRPISSFFESTRLHLTPEARLEKVRFSHGFSRFFLRRNRTAADFPSVFPSSDNLLPETRACTGLALQTRERADLGNPI